MNERIDMIVGILRLPEADSGDDIVYLCQNVFNVAYIEYSWFEEEDLICDVLFIACGDVSFDVNKESFKIASSIKDFVQFGGLVFGFGGGFKLLCLMELLPGKIVENHDAAFVSRQVFLRSEKELTPLTSGLDKAKPLALCVAHRYGRYRASSEELRSIRQNEQIVFRYCDAQGNTSMGVNIDGSVDNIAAISNETNTVFGMMARPERCVHSHYNGDDGLLLFKSIMACSLEK